MMRHVLLVSTVTTLLAASAAGPSIAAESTDRVGPDAVIQVSDDAIAGQVPSQVIGANHRWPNSGLGMWDAEADQPLDRMVDLATETNIALVRYPGGTVANLFKWKRAIGPQEQRGCQVGGGFVGRAEPMDSVYGPDEHERFVDAIGAETTIMTNGSGQPASDAADYVEYMNAPLGTNPNGGTAWARVRAENGHPEPYGVRVWEVGNEVYLGNQHYWRSPDTTVGLRQYVFGGTQEQIDQPAGTECDHRPSAAISDGTPNQAFTVRYPPVVPASQAVRVDGAEWQPVERLVDAGPADPVYEFDPNSGRIRFGDGQHGAIPPADAEVRADYTSGPHPGFIDYYAAMKAVDPTISICSAWEKPEFVELMGTEHPYDCIGPHIYARPDVSGTAEEIHERNMALAADAVTELDELEKAIAEHAPDDAAPYVEVSEYGQISLPATRPPPRGYPGWLSTALLHADILFGLIEHDVALAASSNLNGPNPTAGEVFGGAPSFVNTARARMLGLASELVDTTPVASRIPNNPKASDGGDYRALRVLTTRGADGSVRIFVLNKDPERDITGRMQIKDISGTGTATIKTLNGPSMTSFNNATNPDAVSVSTDARTVRRSSFAHRFPAHSVTLIELAS